DFGARNHHEAKSVFHRIQTDSLGKRVADEVERACDFLRSAIELAPLTIVPAANHHDFFEKWIEGEDWKKDSANAISYLESALTYAKLAAAGVDREDVSLFRARFEQLHGRRKR